MFLPILPERARADLGEAGFPGLTAVYRPMDIEDKARWFDEVEGDINSTEAAVLAVKRQLITIEGITAGTEGSEPVDFDGQNLAHFKALPMTILIPIYDAIINRTALNEGERKN